MAKLLQRRWDSKLAGIDLPRRDRESCTYHAYVPDELKGRAFSFEGGVTADVSDAEHAIVALNIRATTLVDTEAVAIPAPEKRRAARVNQPSSVV
jgi:hypothetical protein